MLSIITNNLGKIAIGAGVVTVSGASYWLVNRRLEAKVKDIIALRADLRGRENELNAAKNELELVRQQWKSESEHLHEQWEATTAQLTEASAKVAHLEGELMRVKSLLTGSEALAAGLRRQLDAANQDLSKAQQLMRGQAKYIEELSSKAPAGEPAKSNAATPKSKKKAAPTAETGTAPMAQAQVS